MKRILMLVVSAVLFVTAMDAQIVSSTSHKITAKKTSGWSELYLNAEFGNGHCEYEGASRDVSFTNPTLGYMRAIGLSSSAPIYLRPGVAVGAAFGDDVSTFVHIDPMVDFGYMWEPTSSVGLFPHVGITTRVGIWGDDDMYDVCNRFQIGGRIGVDAHFSNFILGVDYGFDFSNLTDNEGFTEKLSGVSVKIGLAF